MSMWSVLKEALAEIKEAGARHSKADSNMIQQVHDHAVGLGAACAMDESETPPGDPNVTESFTGDTVPLIEKAIRADGTMPIKVIQPGWGSSGYYSKEVLERDGPKVFSKGLHLYIDHPTESEASDRPERSIKDLAATLAGDARWNDNGPAGAGLYAEANVAEHFRPVLNSLSKDIGVSIRASGIAEAGNAEGRAGKIIKQLTAAESVDFVTKAGAGGKILQLYEAARSRQPNTQENEMTEQEANALKESAAAATAKVAELTTGFTEMKTENAKLRETLIFREGKEFVAAEVGKVKTIPDIMRDRLIRELSANPPIKDGKLDEAALKTAVEAKLTEAKEELKALGVGRVVGMGTNLDEGKSDADVLKDARARMKASMVSMGMKESTAELAAAGR